MSPAEKIILKDFSFRKINIATRWGGGESLGRRRVYGIGKMSELSTKWFIIIKATYTDLW